MNFEAAYKYITEFLPANLPDFIRYHNLEHTIEVVKNAEMLAYGERVDGEALILLKTAALFHDTGFTKMYDKHEYASVEIAREVLPRFDYNESQIERVAHLIMITIYPPEPQDILEKIISDADILYIGDEDFDKVARNLESEFKHEHIVKSHEDWLRIEYNFLKNAKFYTNTAKQMCDAGLKRNLRLAKQQYLESQHKA